MEVKKGYKQTEVGVIPEDWDVQPLSRLTNQVIDGTHHTPKYTDSGIPFLRVTDIQLSKINFSTLKFISCEEHQVLKNRCNPVKGDLLLSKNGTIGIPKIVTWDWEFSIFVSLALLKLKSKRISANYLYQFIKSDYLTEQIRQRSKQGTVTNLHLEEIREFLIPLPPTKAEQTTIATALSDADALIQSLEKLITKKRLIKQGAMQELLKTKEGWVVKKLGEVADILTGFPFQSSGYVKSGTRLLRGSNIKRGITDWSEDISQYWPKVTFEIGKYQLKKDDIVVAMDGSLVGKSFAQLDESDLPALLLQRVARIRAESADINYLKELVCSELFTTHCESVKTVTAIPHISPADIGNFSVQLPPTKKEQTRIATILSDMDNEISTLETKLAKYKQVKQGMMQELLTGRIRLI